MNHNAIYLFLQLFTCISFTSIHFFVDILFQMYWRHFSECTWIQGWELVKVSCDTENQMFDPFS